METNTTAHSLRIIIREMEARDVREVSLIERESFRKPWSEESFLAEVKSEFKHRFSRFFVAETVDGSIAGYAGIWFYSGEGHIVNIAVRKDLRYMGVGKSLLKHMLDFASENGARSFFLEVASHNAAARRMYESFGFREYAVRRHYYPGDDALLMSLKYLSL